jgi:hypothetical protein
VFNHPLDKARPLHHVGPQQQSQNIASGNTTMSDKAATAPRTPAGASGSQPANAVAKESVEADGFAVGDHISAFFREQYREYSHSS